MAREKSKSTAMPHRGLGDDRRNASGSRNVCLTIFITSVSNSESLMSFTKRFSHFSKSPGLWMMFDVVERNGKFGRLQCQRSDESNSGGKRKRRVFFCGKTVRVKVKSKVIPASFLKVEERGMLIGAKDQREWDR